MEGKPDVAVVVEPKKPAEVKPSAVVVPETSTPQPVTKPTLPAQPEKVLSKHTQKKYQKAADR